MMISIFTSPGELNKFVADKIKTLIQQKPDSLLCLPSGSSPMGVFKELIRMNKSGEIDFGSTYFVGLDEWVAIGRNHPGSCVKFMHREFFDHINASPSRICFFDGEASDLIRECKRIDEFIFNHETIDLILLGVGMNGHLGLNEPGVNPGLLSHVMDVDETTQRVAREKYFDQPVTLKRGVTLGLVHITRAKNIIAILVGKHKAQIAKTILECNIGPEVPASMLRTLEHATFCFDQEAASLF